MTRTVPVRAILPSLARCRLPKGKKTARAWVGVETVLELPVIDDVDARCGLPAATAFELGAAWRGNPALEGACAGGEHWRARFDDGTVDGWCPFHIRSLDRVPSYPEPAMGLDDARTRRIRDLARGAGLDDAQMRKSSVARLLDGTRVVPVEAVVVEAFLNDALDREIRSTVAGRAAVVAGRPMLASAPPEAMVSLPMGPSRRRVEGAVDWPDRLNDHTQRRLYASFPLPTGGTGFTTVSRVYGPGSDFAGAHDALPTTVVRERIEGDVVTGRDTALEPLQSETLRCLKRETSNDHGSQRDDPFHLWAQDAVDTVAGREAAMEALVDMRPASRESPHHALQDMVTALVVARERTFGAAWRDTPTYIASRDPGLDTLADVSFGM